LFLVSAYSDFRKSPPTVKIVVFAHRDFDEAVSCVHSKLVRPARLSWINYVTEERALWRAGYMECEVPAITTSAEPRIELQSSSAAPGAAGVVIPIGHTTTLPLSDTSATVNGKMRGGSTTAPKFGLCVKSGYGAPSAARFVEWMELHILLGVAHVILYDQNLRGPVRVAMQHYVDSGRLTVVHDEFRSRLEHSRPDLAKLFAGFDATFASGDEPYAQMELLSIQDCFHRFRGLYDYILVADIDEAIVPVSTDTLPDLVEILKQKHPHATSFSHQAAAYLPHFVSKPSEAAVKNPANTVGTGKNSGSYSHVSESDGDLTYMLMHTRHPDISWDGSKAFHSTGDTDVLNWHRRIWPDTNVALVNSADAWLHHYRASCKGASCDPNATLVDDEPAVMGRYAVTLTSRVAAVMSQLRPVSPPT